MVSTTARIAGKPVTLLSLNPVATEPKKICLQIDVDPRLAAAAGGAARYFADAAGLENEAIIRFQADTVTACTQAFASLNSDFDCVEVTVAQFPDRIEVAIAYRGDAVKRLTKYLV
jgi:hypothetical protein